MEYGFARRFDGITGSAIRQIFSLLGDPEIISFAGGNPSPESFPKDVLSKMAERILAEQGDTILQYGGTAGIPYLLNAVKKKFEKEGLAPSPEELIILTGSSQGIELLSKAMIDPGDVVLVESPTFLGALQTFWLYQAKLIGVETDEEGIVLEDLEAKIQKYHPKFLYTIPTFQNPSGKTLKAERRRKIAELAAKYSMIVLEDDPYGELRYEGEHQPSIKSFDQANMVVKLMSFSKTISPGLRVGAAYGPKEIIHKFNLGKQGQDVHTSNLTQALAAEYLDKGYYEKGVEKNCRLYGDKCRLMYDLAVKYMPEGSKIVKPEGGMFLWIELPVGMDATAMFQKAVENKVAYVPGTHFYAEGGHHNTMRLNFTMVSSERIERGMGILGKLFAR